MRYAVGVDLGGTHLRVALVTEQGTILAKETIEVHACKELDPLFKKLISSIKAVAGNYLPKLSGIGLGFPGICNPKEGMVYQMPHLPRLKNIPVRQLLQKDFACPIIFANDANMGAWGEHWKGAAQSLNNFILLTLGTGIGGGLFWDGTVWSGEEGFAGEVGHMTIEVGGRQCACGNQGCWETYAASQAVPEGTTAQALAQAADQGDPKARQFWQGYGSYLGIGISNLAKITGVGHFCLSGSITKAHPHFINNCLEEIKKRTTPRLAQKVKVFPSTLNGDGNLLGAAYCVFQA